MNKKLLHMLIFASSFFWTTVTIAGDYDTGVYELNRGEFKAAFLEFEPLVAEGYAPAQYQMALIYKNGYAVQKNTQKAFELFSLAASQNYPEALFSLAVMYSTGDGVSKDLVTAFALAEKAANKNFAPAQFNLGVMYAQGDGVKQSYLKASQWYQKAADLNHPLAQFNLALMYYEGKGVEKSLEKSYLWNIISAKNGYPDAAKSRDMDEHKLSIDQIKQAREDADVVYDKIIFQQEMKNKIANQKKT